MKRWRVVARDVDGTVISEFGRRWTWAGALRLRRKWASGVPEPIPGRPMYSVLIERRVA